MTSVTINPANPLRGSLVGPGHVLSTQGWGLYPGDDSLALPFVRFLSPGLKQFCKRPSSAGVVSVSLQHIVSAQKLDPVELLTHPHPRIRKIALEKYAAAHRTVLQEKLEQTDLKEEELIELITRAYRDKPTALVSLALDTVKKHFDFSIGIKPYYRKFCDFYASFEKIASEKSTETDYTKSNQ